MSNAELIKLLTGGRTPVITVFGDYCLDKYLYIDASRDEPSLETGLTAFQIGRKKLLAGGAGTIVNNLRALTASVLCVGVVGCDGEGYELLRALERVGADTSLMVRADSRCTCAYVKPMRCENGRETEINRQDFKNFTKTPACVEDALLISLRQAAERSDAVIVCDQFVEEDCAAVTANVRDGLHELAREFPEVIFYVDSRAHIHRFRGCMIKCNDREIAQVFGKSESGMGAGEAAPLAQQLHDELQKTVFVTLGGNGIVACSDGQTIHVPAFPVHGEIDIVGAGDACNAAIVYALTKGADAGQAALCGNAAGNLAIHQIGTTGTAPLGELVRLVAKS